MHDAGTPNERAAPLAGALPAGAACWIEDHLPASWESAHVVADTPRSVVAKFETPAGLFFFKSDRCLPPAEALVIDRLKHRWPGFVAPVVALELDRGWSLTHDVGAPGFEAASTEDWCRVAQAFGRVQRDSGASADDWIGLGCRDRRGMRLLAALEAMLEDVEPMLDPDVVRRLRALRSHIREACRALAEDPVPAALVHQDLVPVNIVLADGEPRFLDWSDTVVGHPFFGLDRLLDSCWTHGERNAAVIDAYLATFADLARPARLRASFQHVLWLRVLYEDLRWHDELAAVDRTSEHAAGLRRDMVLGLTQMAQAQG